MSCAKIYLVFGCPFICFKWQNQAVLVTFGTEVFSIFWCTDLVIFVSSTSGNQSPNVPNDALPDGSGLSMGVLVNARMNEAQTFR